MEESENDLLAIEVEKLRQRFQRIKSEQQLGNDGSTDRGQISADSSFEKVVNYNLIYGFEHVFELRDAINKWKQHLDASPHLLDLGCGIGLTDLVLRTCGFETLSYIGVDHNPEMLKLALQLNLGSTFTNEIRSVPRRRGRGLLVINHLFGQNELTAKDISDFAFYSARVFDQHLSVLNVEPKMSRVDINRQAFRNALSEVGYSEDSWHFAETTSQFRTPKNSWFAQYTFARK
jgi:SAM-dependent methyltransferase